MNKRAIALFLCVAFALAALILGCGGGGDGGGGNGGGNGGGTGVTVVAPKQNLAFGESMTITASVPGQADQTVIFSADAGNINQTGPDTAVYTAPGTAGTYHITVRADANPNLVQVIIVHVSSVSITINPSSASLKVGATATFSAIVNGTANKAATFKASAGTVTPISGSNNSVTFKAPATPGTVTITATSSAETAQRATATVIVTANGPGNTATVTGKVVDENNAGVKGITVIFLNNTGTQVAQATTVAGGTFSVSVPVTAKTFNLAAGSIPQSFYENFVYRAIGYSPLVSGCNAPLPALSAGVGAALSGSISIASTATPPPPPPNGCS